MKDWQGYCFLALALLSGVAAFGQDVRWEDPGAVILVDFTSPKTSAKLAFLADGLAWETPLDFAMLRDSLTIVIKHPEPGRAEAVVRSRAALVDLKTEPPNEQETRIKVQGKMAVMNREGAAAAALKQAETLWEKPRELVRVAAEGTGKSAMEKYLRESGIKVPGDPAKLKDLYIQARAVEDAKEAILESLEALIVEKPAWATEKEQAAWRSASGRMRLAAYLRLLQLKIAEEHLRQCGLELDTNRRAFDALILTKLEGVYAITSGNTGASEEAQRAVRTLTREELAGLKKALTVSLACRFYPRTNSADANSQWYNGQRVSCQARGVAMIRAHGELDSSRQDAVDWWTLTEYDESEVQIQFPQADGIRYEVLADGPRRARLRIMALGSGPIAYKFELTPREPVTGETIELHETLVLRDASFPF